jgi:hypothetical protein
LKPMSPERDCPCHARRRRLVSTPPAPQEASLDPGVGNTAATVDFEKSVASRSQLDWVTGLVNTHAKFVQDLTGFYIKAAREALK